MKPEVSIICNSYNQEEYIAKAIESFLMQKTTFPFEILIHEDASTDKTAEIIKSYEEKYSDIIKPIYEVENQYSQGNLDFLFQSQRIQGKYVALCEGDDYWTDDCKLQKQYDIMEKNLDIDICAHQGTIINAITNKKIKRVQPSKTDTIFSIEDVIKNDGEFVLTNSLFFRSDIYVNPPQFLKENPLDYILQIAGSLRGGMIFLKDDMSIYRRMTKASVSTEWKNDMEKSIQLEKKVIHSLKMINEYTNYQYNDVISNVIAERSGYRIPTYKRDYDAIIKDPFFATLPLQERIKVYIKKVIRYKI